MHSILRILLACLCFVFIGDLQEAKPGIIENGDFESGELSGWTTFTTPNGTLGAPEFPDSVMFDTNGDGVASKSLRFKVGKLSHGENHRVLQGGGIFSNLWLEGGKVLIEADIASSYSSPKDRRNLAGGLFELLLDGRVLAVHDFGPVDSGSTKRFKLKGGASISTGTHEIRVRIRRSYASLSGVQAPQQYLDNIKFMVHPR